MTPTPKVLEAFTPVMFPGEVEAIAAVKALGAAYGYGNLMFHLREAWSAQLQSQGISKQTADYAARHICVWCDVDSRTGKKVKRTMPPRSKRKDGAR